jgi:Ca2+-binding RTX toxin-like protein
VDGGGGYNNIDLAFTGSIGDAAFAGLSHINELDLIGTSHASITLGAHALAAFGAAPIKVGAINSAVINVDGHGLRTGYIGVGGGGADTFIGGAGNDSLYGKGGADEFDLGQGGRDILYDFTPGQDHIKLLGPPIHDWASLAPHLGARTGYAVIDFGGSFGQAWLKGVDFHALSASDFLFT